MSQTASLLWEKALDKGKGENPRFQAGVLVDKSFLRFWIMDIENFPNKQIYYTCLLFEDLREDYIFMHSQAWKQC